MFRRKFIGLGATLAGLGTLPTTWAQAWPARPIKLIVPFIPGSAPDVIARGLSERLTMALGQAVVIDNKPGAGGNIGLDAIAKSAGDGYTLGLGTSSLSINPYLYQKVPFDPISDFTPINLTYAMPHALIVQANGSGAHLCAELFKAMAGVDALHVPYRGAPEIITSVMGASALFGFPTLSTAVPLVKGGKIRALGVTGPKRNAALPDVPPVGDTVQGFEVVSWFGVMAPAKFPVELARRIDQEIQKALADPAFRDKVQADGTEIVGLGHQAFPDYLRQDLQKWKRAVELSGAKVD
ncbi:MAG: tripartite tricarboxylate transporter substrate-binding protein [Burkholderiales bacterium]|nr:tripartite tricarboxylate transporter substrate-binding protein [Burkholderiales bacterium]